MFTTKTKPKEVQNKKYILHMTMEERISNHVCCFCEGELEHFDGQDPDFWGNDPDNACSWDNARCCNYCNMNIVIPVRMYTSKIVIKALADKQ